MSAETLLALVVIAMMLLAGAYYFVKQTTGKQGTVRNWGARHFQETSQDDEQRGG